MSAVASQDAIERRRRLVDNAGPASTGGAPGERAEVLAYFGFTAEHVRHEAGELLKSVG